MVRQTTLWSADIAIGQPPFQVRHAEALPIILDFPAMFAYHKHATSTQQQQKLRTGYSMRATGYSHGMIEI